MSASAGSEKKHGWGWGQQEYEMGYAIPSPPVAFQSSQSGVRVDDVHATLDSNNGSRRHNGVLVSGEPVAFSCKDSGADAGNVSPTLRAMEYDGSHANGGGQVAVATRTEEYLGDAEGGAGDVPFLTRSNVGKHVNNQTPLVASFPCEAEAVAFKASHYTRDKDGAPARVTPPLSADADKGDQDTLVLAKAAPLPFDETQVTSDKNYSNPQHGDPCHPLAATARPPAIAFTGDGEVADPVSANEGSTYTHEGKGNFRLHNCVGQVGAMAVRTANTGANGHGVSEEAAHTLDTVQGQAVAFKPGQSEAAVQNGMMVRRLTPLECERLQGFPDGWTAIPYNGRPGAADGPRYRAIGNSMAVNVMNWIGQRIQMVDGIEAVTPPPK